MGSTPIDVGRRAGYRSPFDERDPCVKVLGAPPQAEGAANELADIAIGTVLCQRGEQDPQLERLRVAVAEPVADGSSPLQSVVAWSKEEVIADRDARCHLDDRTTVQVGGDALRPGRPQLVGVEVHLEECRSQLAEYGRPPIPAGGGPTGEIRAQGYARVELGKPRPQRQERQRIPLSCRLRDPSRSRLAPGGQIG